jgi:hypothetical protein
LGMRVYIRVVMIMVFRIVNFTTRCSCTKTFIGAPGHLLMGRLTTGLVTY